VTNNFKNFYLSYLPDYVNNELNVAGSVKLEGVKEKIEPVLTDLFAKLHNGFVKVEIESDLEQFKKDVDNNLEKLKKLINERNDALKADKEKYKTERIDGTP
jgi:hypothetical protein